MTTASTGESMTGEQDESSRTHRELMQLLRIQERLLARLREMRTDLEAPTTRQILRSLHKSSVSAPDESFGRVTATVEEAIRALQVFESEIKRRLLAGDEEPSADDLPDLPPGLARFLTEKSQNPGFSYELSEDPVRGWTICWKEHTEEGTIRGYGQLYERPHAWIQEE